MYIPTPQAEYKVTKLNFSRTTISLCVYVLVIDSTPDWRVPLESPSGPGPAPSTLSNHELC